MGLIISKKVIKQIKEHPSLRLDLAKANKMGSSRSIDRWLQFNKENGPLTAKANIEVISKCLGLEEMVILTKPNPSPTLPVLTNKKAQKK